MRGGEDMTLGQIGSFLGIDHSTVHHNCTKVSDAIRMPLMYAGIVEKYHRFCEALEAE